MTEVKSFDEIKRALAVLQEASEGGQLAAAIQAGAVDPEILASLAEQASARRQQVGGLTADVLVPPSVETGDLEQRVNEALDSLLFSEPIQIRRRSERIDVLQSMSTDAGKIVLRRLRKALESSADIHTIARLVTILHDFPKNVGGGGLTGMYEIPELRKLLLQRFLLEIQSTDFEIKIAKERDNYFEIPNETLNYLALRLDLIQPQSSYLYVIGKITPDEFNIPALEGEALRKLFRDAVAVWASK